MSKPKSPTNSTSVKAPRNREALIAEVGKLFGQMIEFHEAGDGAESTDVRLCWSVTATRGENVPMAKISGIITLPDFVSDSQIHLAPERITNELISKIVIPTANKFQEFANDRALELTATDAAPGGDSPAPSRTTGLALPNPDDLAVEAELISGS